MNKHAYIGKSKGLLSDLYPTGGIIINGHYPNTYNGEPRGGGFYVANPKYQRDQSYHQSLLNERKEQIATIQEVLSINIIPMTTFTQFFNYFKAIKDSYPEINEVNELAKALINAQVERITATEEQVLGSCRQELECFTEEQTSINR